MRVKLNQNLATVSGQFMAGQEYDIDDAEAKRLIDGGIATDPTGRVTPERQALTGGNPVGKETLDRPAGTPIEKLPSSTGLPGHPFKDPASTGLTAGQIAPGEQVTGAAAGVAATNAPSAEETRAANERSAPLSEGQPGDAPAADGAPAKKAAAKKGK